MFNKLLIPIAIVISAGLIASSIYFAPTPNDAAQPANVSNDPNEPTPITAEISPITDDDHIKGNPDADLVIVEYSDFQCPFCSRFHNTMNQIMNEYGADGQVAWVFRHYPLDNHPQAMPAAIASECVARLGGDDAFFNYSDALFENQENLSTEQLRTAAINLGIDGGEYDSCIVDDSISDLVEQDIDDGNLLARAAPDGRFGTPYNIVVTKTGQQFVIAGAQPYLRVKQIIDTLLQL